MAEEKKDPCAGKTGAALLNCRDNESLAAERVKKYEARVKSGQYIAPKPPERIESATPPFSPRSAQDEQDIKDVLAPMYKRKK